MTMLMAPSKAVLAGRADAAASSGEAANGARGAADAQVKLDGAAADGAAGGTSPGAVGDTPPPTGATPPASSPVA